MSVNIVVPEMGESIVDARVAKWLKHEGDTVAAGEPLVELETDKVDVEVSAPNAGVLEKIAHAKGADVKIGDVLGTIAAGVAAAPVSAPAAASGSEAKEKQAAASPSEVARGGGAPERQTAPAAALPSESSSRGMAGRGGGAPRAIPE